MRLGNPGDGLPSSPGAPWWTRQGRVILSCSRWAWDPLRSTDWLSRSNHKERDSFNRFLSISFQASIGQVEGIELKTGSSPQGKIASWFEYHPLEIREKSKCPKRSLSLFLPFPGSNPFTWQVNLDNIKSVYIYSHPFNYKGVEWNMNVRLISWIIIQLTYFMN